MVGKVLIDFSGKAFFQRTLNRMLLSIIQLLKYVDRRKKIYWTLLEKKQG